MKENIAEQERFYSSISIYYSELFPYNATQLQFVKSTTGTFLGKRILDLGCGTGELALRLANEGAFVTGVDMNKDFIIYALEKNRNENTDFRVLNMLETSSHFDAGYFDAVICFGNTLVHLLTIGSVKKLIKSVEKVLKKGGLFLIQILNYDFILDEKLNSLPVIETEHLKFNRSYNYPEKIRLIRFKTELTVKGTGEKIVNETSLYPIRKEELRKLLDHNGFKEVEFYSDFKMNPAGGDHLPLVVSALKI